MKTSEILQGDVLFLYGDGIIKDAIEFITHGSYHCALFYDQETIIEAQDLRKSGISPLSDYLNTNDRLEVWRDISLTEDEREGIVKYAIHHSGIKYDYFAIFEELVRYELGISIDNYNEGNRRICSSFVNDAAKSIGKVWSKEHIPSPADLAKGGILQRVGILELD